MRVAEYVKHTVKQSRHGVKWTREERSMAEGTVIAENTVGELMQDSVSRTLAIEMLDGVWKAGESLTLEALQSRFGISRTVAREVAKTLESMNAVLVKRRIGLVARPFGEWQALNHQVIEWRLHSTQRERQLSSLTELRLAVEPAAAASAARLAPPRRQGEIPRVCGANAADRRSQRGRRSRACAIS